MENLDWSVKFLL